MPSADFETQLRLYAQLIINTGVALEPRERLLISALAAHRPLALALTRAAYEAGARYVHVLYQDEALERFRLLGSMSGPDLSFVSRGTLACFEEALADRSAFISISGREDLDTYEGIDPEKSGRLLSSYLDQLEFFHAALRRNELKWCVAAAATAGVAVKVFPGVPPERAEALLWREFFAAARLDQPDPGAALDAHLASLAERACMLTELDIDELHFRGPGTDLRVGLSPGARFVGGRSLTREGKAFLANLPTEEVFTAPDFRRVNGRFSASRPLVFKNLNIDELSFEFRDGSLVGLAGSDGIEGLRMLLGNGGPGTRLGEVALVDTDNPVFKSGLVFRNQLYDENAASHVALGGSYPECFERGMDLTDAEAEAAGLNRAGVHVDVMLGTPETEVDALLRDGRTVGIMRGGRFVI